MTGKALSDKSLHSICRWTFNPGKGGFVPGDMWPKWGGKFGTPEMIKLTADKVRPGTPDNVELGIEMHYDAEVDDKNAAAVADALVSNKLYLAMITPGAHSHFAYGGIASLDPNERKAAEELGTKTVDSAHGTQRNLRQIKPAKQPQHSTKVKRESHLDVTKKGKSEIMRERDIVPSKNHVPRSWHVAPRCRRKDTTIKSCGADPKVLSEKEQEKERCFKILVIKGSKRIINLTVRWGREKNGWFRRIFRRFIL